jgi:hypothetical protein
MPVHAAIAVHPRSILRHSPWDAVLVWLSAAHAAALVTIPSVPLVAIALWWNANTIAHNFIHTPFFRSRGLNTVYSVFLSAVQGIPQTLWRHRHLAHHAGRARAFRWTWTLTIELAAIATVWSSAYLIAPLTFLAVYLPGYAAGLVLCYLQGHFEHVHGGTISHYGRLYNLCFFHDGYHVEHHQRPGEHWTELPHHVVDGAERSGWPPVLRWLDAVRPMALGALERMVLRSPLLQRFVVAVHERALVALLADVPPPAHVVIVGGGLFPRTALILQRLLPEATLTVVEEKAAHIDVARRFLGERVTFHHEVYDPRRSPAGADLVIVPLAFDGDREAFYTLRPAPMLLVHDWLWRRKGRGVAISWLLLKRLNLITR